MGKLFFNNGLVSGLILLGKVWPLNLAIACVKGLSSLGSRIALEKLAAIVNPENKLPWKFVGKLFFNKGLVSGLTLLGKVWTLNLAIACVKGLSSLGSRISSGKVCCNCEPCEQTY